MAISFLHSFANLTINYFTNISAFRLETLNLWSFPCPYTSTTCLLAFLLACPPCIPFAYPIPVMDVQHLFSQCSSCPALCDYPGDCHITPWSEWSKCELTCIDGRSFETTGRQSRSRTFIIQSFENQDSCPQQVLETRPCTGTRTMFQCFNQYSLIPILLIREI